MDGCGFLLLVILRRRFVCALLMVWLDAVEYDSVWRASTCSGRVTALPSETPQKAGLVGHGNDSGWKVKLTSNAEVSFSGSSVTTPASNGGLSSECSMPEEGVVGQDVSIGSSSMGSVPESGSSILKPRQ
ncbi:unnamed protein product [Caenorhabditis bovis]|uniref:Secreted protein n=1 Tax=Caenorhabditis bovis TaxID=2654633 RepID=A0A8S1FCX4_9PELO|nr:unnamed protein product [Caenorhabditis bovis]